ncbi:MAG: tetratricopeptide repeat protein [Steroidobacteraceae bacterium]
MRVVVPLTMLLVASMAIGSLRAATPAHRPDPGTVVLTLPAAERVRATQTQRMTMSQALEFAAALYDRGQQQRDVREFGRAEQVLQPWTQPDVAASVADRAAVLVLQARLLQRRHRFADSLELLDRALALDPSLGDARLLRAGVQLTRGAHQVAGNDCRALLRQSELFAGSVCLAQVQAATGSVAQALELLDSVLPRGPQDAMSSGAAAQLGWALAVRAELAQLQGDLTGAQTDLQRAIELDPAAESARVALADVLLATGKAQEVSRWLDLPQPSPAMLLRELQAFDQSGPLTSAGAERAKWLRAALDSVLALDAARGEHVHLREQAEAALLLDQQPCRARDLAMRNFELQRERPDIQLLAHAAQQCGEPTDLTPLREWLRQSGFRDERTERWLTELSA